MTGSRRSTKRLSCAARLACVAALAGCNAILGINPPSDQVLDAGHSGVLALRGKLPTSSASAPVIDERDAATQGITTVPGSTGAWAVWPMPNPVGSDLPNEQSYSTQADDVMTDNVTQLEWQQSVDGKPYAWSEAVDHCAGLDTDGGGWRLPSRIELYSLVDFTSANPTIDSSAFPDTPAEHFWSSSRFVGDRASAWGVNFGFSVGFAFKDPTSATHLVRCVR
jgi:hypothetical protein